MNVLTFPTAKFSVKENGQLSDEYFNFFTMNTQQQQYYFSNDGHLTPMRTTSDLTALSTDNYTGRYAYNSTTDSPMVNVNGTYLNIATSFLLSPSRLFSMNHTNHKRLHLYQTEDDRLFVTINGKLREIQLKEVS
jgi:hypothetical protein